MKHELLASLQQFLYLCIDAPRFLLYHIFTMIGVFLLKEWERSMTTVYSELTWGTGGRAVPASSLSEVVPMSTYEELSLIVSVALLIVAILTYTHKK